MSAPADDPIPRNTWTSLFQQTSAAIFLLNPRRRIRYVNRAFETLARTTADLVVHEYCHPRKIQKDIPATRRALLQALAPPRDVMQGRIARIRRPVPPARLGPPWWEITFVPLREGDKLLAVLGTIEPVGQPGSTAGGRGLPESLIALRQQAAERYPLALFVGDHPTQRRLHTQAQLAAKNHAPVWLHGAPGTGKETLARAIHYHGVTRELSFACIDCAGLQPYLIRSVLSGHNGLVETGRVGTIYLKSPESLPPDLQVEMLEWAELLEDECRIVVSSTEAAGLSSDFRAAFGIVEIQLPTLIERMDELPSLIAKSCSVGVSPETLEVFSHYSWPGNLTELCDVLSASTLRANGNRIEVNHLPQALRQAASYGKSAALAGKQPIPPKLDEVLEQVERRMIEMALKKSKGDQTAAAESLGIYRNRLIRRIKLLGLSPQSE